MINYSKTENNLRPKEIIEFLSSINFKKKNNKVQIEYFDKFEEKVVERKKI